MAVSRLNPEFVPFVNEFVSFLGRSINPHKALKLYRPMLTTDLFCRIITQMYGEKVDRYKVNNCCKLAFDLILDLIDNPPPKKSIMPCFPLRPRSDSRGLRPINKREIVTLSNLVPLLSNLSKPCLPELPLDLYGGGEETKENRLPGEQVIGRERAKETYNKAMKKAGDEDSSDEEDERAITELAPMVAVEDFCTKIAWASGYLTVKKTQMITEEIWEEELNKIVLELNECDVRKGERALMLRKERAKAAAAGSAALAPKKSPAKKLP